jgi:APA family basic amino acid/polyamine antiporter
MSQMPIAPVASNPQGVVELRRLVGVGFGVAVVLGGMIGIGILRTPAMVAGWVSSPSLILGLWAVAGLYILINAMCLAELAAAFPRAGGPYVFARRAFGDFAGFAVGWVDWSLNAGGVAFLAVAFADYAALVVPVIGLHPGISAATVIGILALLNWFGLSLGSVVQQTLSALKAIAFLVLIIGCFVVRGQPASVAAVSAVHLPTATVPLILGVVLSLQPILEAYGGWNSAVYFAEEDQNPERNILRSMVGGDLLEMAI